VRTCVSIVSPPAAATLPRYVCVHVCVLRGLCVLVFMYVSHSSLETPVKSPITDDMCGCECE